MKNKENLILFFKLRHFVTVLTYTCSGDVMKKVIIIGICILLQCSLIHAESYCVLSSVDNTVIEEKDMHKQQSVASISKIMTAIIAIEEGNLEDTWKVSDAITTAVGSSIYLKVGQEVSLKSLLYGLMLRSGNDAAKEIAVHISGDETAFVQKMNEKAKAIGMLNTVFENASGLDEDGAGNVSTAYDMALLMSYAMKNPIFCEIDSAKNYTSEWGQHWKNKNKLLFEFPFTTGGKTGFTKKAGRTLVSSAANDTMKSVVVTLAMSDDFNFHEEKHKQAFDTIQVMTILKAGTFQYQDYEITVDVPLEVSLHKDGSDAMEVYTHMQRDTFVVEIRKNKQSDVYEYPAKHIQTSWWKKVFS